MNLIQILPLVTISISLYVAIFHFYLYLKGPANRTNLSFTLVCLYMCLFALICFMNYNVSAFANHLFWVKIFYISFPLFPAAFIHFVYDFTDQGSRKIPWILTAVCLLEMLIMLGLSLVSEQEQLVTISVDFMNFSYVAFQGSPAMETMKILILTSAYVIILPTLNLIFRSYRAGNSVARPILIGALLFLLCGINDTLVETRVYSFLYLGEYGGLFLILGMALAMINRMAKIQQEMNQARALTAIGRMATEVVHDLTTPLDAIKLAATIARTDGNGEDTREKYLSMIEKETSRLSNLSFDILQFVSRERPLVKQTVNLNEYMQEVVFLIQGDFDKHQISLRYLSHYDGRALIDPDAFKRVVLNLAGNARESLVQNAADSPEFVISVHKQARQLVFGFSDNGPGIPEGIQAQIFEPFTTFGKTSGSGLGLAISKQIVNRHGGSISCESTPQQGAVFHITLPA
ncbi:MAG: ATP-binding protein [Sedimenticola sp.]